MIDLCAISPNELDALRLVEEKCHVGLMTWDLATSRTQWSSGLFALLGMPVGSVQPTFEQFRDMIHPDDRLSSSQAAERIQSALPFQQTVRVIRQDGRVRWLSIHYEFVLDPTGKAQRLVGVATDTTAERDRLQRSRMHAERFRTMVEPVAPIVWTSDADGMVCEVSGWENVTGRPDKSALGRNWLDAVHENDRDTTRSALARAVRSRRFFDHSHRLERPDGSYRWFRSCGAPTIAGDGSVVDWRGLIIDTHRRGDESDVDEQLSGAQIRASRALLKWSVADLARASGLTPAVIRRLEEFDGRTKEKARVAVAIIRSVIEAAGVELIFADGEAPGVRPTERMDGVVRHAITRRRDGLLDSGRPADRR